MTGRLDVKASQTIITKPITAIREIVEPIEDTTFQVV